jgi:hypothetical protein
MPVEELTARLWMVRGCLVGVQRFMLRHRTPWSDTEKSQHAIWLVAFYARSACEEPCDFQRNSHRSCELPSPMS